MAQLQKRGTRRQQRIESVLQYIEAHNGESVDVSALASMASISPFHFHRVFSAQVGEPVLAYIRRLRLEKAAYRILFMDNNVTEAAALAGYSSAAAFTRAFRQHFGTTPKKFVRKLLECRPRDQSQNTGMPSGPVYRRMAPLNLLGVKRLGAYDRAPWEAWSVLRAYLRSIADEGKEWTRIGLPLDWPELTPEPRRRYEACVVSDAAPEGEFFRKQLAGGTHAIFLHRGPYQELQAAHEKIFWNWLPGAEVQLRDAPAFHIYTASPDGRAGTGSLITEICIPVEMPQVSRSVFQIQQSLAQAEW